jgi:(p)ppGpp synthase/HD superfamily hydrolase
MVENREAFFRRLEPFFAPSDVMDVQVAYTLAKSGHRSQIRKEKDGSGNPVRYFEHPRRVALILIDEVRIVDKEMVVCALLHDGVEDTREVTPRMLEHLFGPDVCRIVQTLSKAPKEGYLDRFMASTDWRPYVIKACDRLDNLRSLQQAELGFRRKQVEETKTKLFPLFDRMTFLAPEVHRGRISSLRDSILAETFRQEALAGIE